jgi:hypothetical protein
MPEASFQEPDPVAVAGWLEVDRLASENRVLRARIDAVLTICDRHERGAMRWADPLPVPSWVPQIQRLLLGDDPTAKGRLRDDTGTAGLAIFLFACTAGALLWLAVLAGGQQAMCAIHDDALRYCPGYVAEEQQ